MPPSSSDRDCNPNIEEDTKQNDPPVGRVPSRLIRRRSPPTELALGLSKRDFDALPVTSHHRIAYHELFESLPSARAREWAATAGLELRSLREVDRKTGVRSEKLLLRLRDGYTIETVRIRRRDGYTACVSSQVGCAFGCRFCASGQAGLMRNLAAGEIVEQLLWLGRVNRIVFMGIGEPLHNYDAVMGAIRILRDRNGLRFPTAGITISTIGIPKALARLREEHLAIQLTISLHATTQEVRAKLIPGSRNHDLHEVVNRALSWADRHNRVVTFVYLVLPGINDDITDANRLVRMLEGRRARVNLMRLNPVRGASLGRTPDEALSRFRRAVASAGIQITIRDTQGSDIVAACGQLWLRDTYGVPMRKRGESQ